MRGRTTTLVVLIIIVMLGIVVWEYRNSPWLSPLLGSNTNAPATAEQQVGKASYSCDAAKTIVATYYQGAAPAVAAGSSTPPMPNGSVAIVLSDGRSMTLPQTLSGSGIRYSAADGSIVFWSKGNTAFVTEGADQKQSFANCIAVSNISGQESWKTFASSTAGFSIRYPDGYTPSAYVYQALGPGKDINGIKFTIPESMATGTNLASDTYVSVETLPKATECTAAQFLGDEQVGSSTELVDNGVTYSTAKGSGAGAGNLYTEYVYAIPGTVPCTAVRYFIHSGQLGNYPPGTIAAFSEPNLVSEFDGIRRSLLLAK